MKLTTVVATLLALAATQTRQSEATAAPVASPPPPNPFATLAFTKATILSGGLKSCLPSPNVTDCTGGLATASFVLRTRAAELGSQHSAMYTDLDVDSPFVLMHPSDYAVNIDIFRHFGITSYFANPSIIADRAGRPQYSKFFNDDVKMLQCNVQVSASDDWYGFIQRETVLFGSKVGLSIAGYSGGFGNTSNPVERFPAVIRYLRPRTPVVVAAHADSSVSGLSVLAGLGNNPPDVFLDLAVDTAGPCRPIAGTDASGGKVTQYCPLPTGGSVVNLLHIYLNPAGDAFSAVAAESLPITDLPLEDFDAQYFADQEYLAVQANISATFDPIIGHTNVRMPVGGAWESTNGCYAGECAQGTLNGRALLYNDKDADVAISGAGGYRGNGWAPGPIRTSDIWDMMPYADTLVSARILGYKFWQLMNVSLYFYSGSSAHDPVADRFIQGQGYRIEYDSSKPRFTNRLLSIEIRNKTTGRYEPLERTKYYTLATDAYMFNWMPESGPILKTAYRGESFVDPFGTDLRQVAFAKYLNDHSPYDELTSGNLIPVNNANGARVPMDWRQSPSDCGGLSFWDAGIVTCVACPKGFMAGSGTGSTASCVPMQCGAGASWDEQRGECVSNKDSSNTTTIIIAVVIPVVALLALAAAAIIFVERRRRSAARDVNSAPKAGDHAAIIFTDIQSSTKLWGTVPASMAIALDIHHNVIRQCIAEFGGYEVKTIGDSFMIACGDLEKAAGMAVAIQERLWVQRWPKCINDAYDCEGHKDEVDRLDEVDDEPDVLTPAPTTAVDNNNNNQNNNTSNGLPSHNGVRVRIGFNYGQTDAVFDEITKGYDYYGPTVNLAARVEAAGQGGQILTSRGTANLLAEDKFATNFFMEAELYGIAGVTELFEVLPPALRHSGRAFSPARSKVNLQNKGMLQGGGAGGNNNNNTTNYNSDGVVDFNNNNGAFMDLATKDTNNANAVSDDGFERNSSTGSAVSRGNANSAASSDNLPAICRATINTAVMLLRPKEKETVVNALARSWQVQTGQEASLVITGISIRVVPALRKALRSIERRALRGTGTGGGQTPSTGAGGGGTVVTGTVGAGVSSRGHGANAGSAYHSRRSRSSGCTSAAHELQQ